jgi:hypothetical protein
MRSVTFYFLVAASSIAFAVPVSAQSSEKPPVNFTAEQDHQNMMDQLGIRALRPGPSGDESAPNHANYNEALPNPYPDLPPVLVLADGQKVTTAKLWWDQRRPQIVDAMSREVYGFIPANVPKVTWAVVASEREQVGGIPVLAKELVGHVDNSGYPWIDVNLSMTLLTPADSSQPVPVLMMFRRTGLPSAAQPPQGDAEWLDQKGSYMATVAAQPVFELLGAKGMGVPDDPSTAKMPPVNDGLLGGQLAWRQHDGGHTDAPNVKYFLQWVDRNIGYSPHSIAPQ